jgi:hypothetical protein
LCLKHKRASNRVKITRKGPNLFLSGRIFLLSVSNTVPNELCHQAVPRAVLYAAPAAVLHTLQRVVEGHVVGELLQQVDAEAGAALEQGGVRVLQPEQRKTSRKGCRCRLLKFGYIFALFKKLVRLPAIRICYTFLQEHILDCFYVLYLIPFHILPLRFDCVGGCWD